MHLLAGDETGRVAELVRLPRFEGVAGPTTFLIRSDAFVVRAVAFDGRHEEAVDRLRRMLISDEDGR